MNYEEREDALCKMQKLADSQSTIGKFDIDPSPTITFADPNGTIIGAVYIKDGCLQFEGNASESALLLFEELKRLWNIKGGTSE